MLDPLHRRLLDSWNMRDADAYASLFEADGTLVGFDGSMMDGRDAILEHIAAIFADHEVARYVRKVLEVRELGAGVGLLRAIVGMVPPGKTDIDPNANAVQTLVARDGELGWRIAHFQNTPAQFHGRPEEGERLTAELRDELRRAERR